MSIESSQYYRMAFEHSFVTKLASEFEQFFCDLMYQVYGPDFEAKPPWGRKGDAKCDGLLKSKRFLFACHAPQALKVSQAKTKIRDDFDGAKANWKGKFDTWIYVNNQRNGLPKDLQEFIDDLDTKTTELTVTQWGFHDLLREFSQLDDKKRAILFGASLSRRDFSDIHYDDVKNILSVISHMSPLPVGTVKPVSAEKLAGNGLSEHVTQFLRLGMSGAPTVKKYIDSHYDAEYGDRLASAFRAEYERLAATESDPDVVFCKLQDYLKMHQQDSPAYQSAGYAVLAHFFETCDIYREPSSEGPK